MHLDVIGCLYVLMYHGITIAMVTYLFHVLMYVHFSANFLMNLQITKVIFDSLK